VSPEGQKAVKELRQACACLYLELPACLANQVKEKADVVIAEFELVAGSAIADNKSEKSCSKK